MQITLYHDARVPPLHYGGTERVFYWLAKGLSSLGHSVSLIARKGSHVPGVTVIPCHQNDWESLIPAQTDILHLANTPQRALKKPYLVTIGGYGQKNEIFHPNTLFVSQSHARFHNSQHFVYNGIDITDYFCDTHRENYLVFLAKASWKVKNLIGAITLAQKAQLPLYVMGNRNHSSWWDRFFRSFRRHPPIHYFGMVGDLEKRELLRKAKALLFPVRWHEPFGLAVTEALASGCPVFGTPYGSLPEIITPQTGRLSTHSDELAKICQEHVFSPQACRNRVTQGFTHLQMAQNYLKYYEQILTHGDLSNDSIPIQIQSGFQPNDLLFWK